MAHNPDHIAEAAVGLLALLVARLDRLGVASLADLRKAFEPVREHPENQALAPMQTKLLGFISALERDRDPRPQLRLIQGGLSAERPEDDPGPA